MKEDYYMGSDVEYEIPKNKKSKKKSSNEDGGKFDFLKNKKVMFIIGAIVLILFLIIIVSCSNGGEKSVNNNLGGVNITNGEITPAFDAGTLEYSVLTTEDSVELSCYAESISASVIGCGDTVYLEDECVEHIVNVISESGMTKDYTFTICKQSKEAPVITDVKLSTENFTNDNIIVSVIVESKNDLHEAAYSFDGGNSYQASNEYTLTENKILEIKVRDIYENVSATYPKEINLIDRTTPTVSIKGSVASGNQTSSNVVLTSFVEPSETLSGYTYQWYKNNIQILNATKSTYTATSSGSYKVEVTTGSGNKATSSEYNVNKLTTTTAKNNNTTTNKNTTTKKATVTISSVGGNPSSWTKNDVKLTINASASLGLHDKPYSFDNGKTYTSSKSMSFSKNQDVYIVVRDKDGNTTSYIVYITKIDKTKPSVTISGNTTIGSKLTAKVSPTSTPSGYKYQWYKESSLITGATSSSYTANSSGNYYVKVTTGAGNSASSSKINIQPNKPGNVTLKSSVSENEWTNQSVTLTASVTSGTAKKYIWQKNGSTINTTTNNTYVINNDTNDNYSVKVEFTNSTSTTSNKINLKIDKTGPTKPTAKFNSDNKNYNADGSSWTNKNVSGELYSSDSLSGIKYYEYSYDCTGYASGNLPDGNKNPGYINEGKYNTCFRAVDNVGNKGEWSSKYIIQIDKTAPYTPYIPDWSNASEFSCYSKGKIIEQNELTREYKYCAGLVTNYVEYIAEVDDRFGIDRCEYAAQDTNGVAYGGSLGNFSDDSKGNNTGYNTITWEAGRWPSQTLPKPDVTKRGMGYIRRCYDKAGNVSNAIFLIMF